LPVREESNSPTQQHRERSVSVLGAVREGSSDLYFADHRARHCDVPAFDGTVHSGSAFRDPFCAGTRRGSGSAVEPNLTDLRNATSERDRQSRHDARDPPGREPIHPLQLE
jgi:hypothetical protein